MSANASHNTVANECRTLSANAPRNTWHTSRANMWQMHAGLCLQQPLGSSFGKAQFALAVHL
eukprot:100937-Pelagomonas_calceolata.AAC.11